MFPKQYIIAVLFLVTGAALIVGLFTKIPFLLILILFVLFALIAGKIIYKKLKSAQRKNLRHRLISGLTGGFLATAAYDSSRYLLSLLFSSDIWPFEAIPLFGQLLIGRSFSREYILATGALYHLINGIAFGIAYSILLASKGRLAGILWALGLEAVMLVVYPNWLNIKFFEEFVSISVLGHIIYGFVLGMVCRLDFLRRVTNVTKH